MNQRRLKFLLWSLCFDYIDDRSEWKKVNKLAKIILVFDPFVDRCKTAFTQSEYLPLDEMLESFCGQCSFKQYMPKKFHQIWNKDVCAILCKQFYTVKLEIYTGNQPAGPYQQSNRVTNVVQRMIKPVIGTGRNITMDYVGLWSVLWIPW